jgi:type II secretory pathway component GspD/PulD (secretin)
MLKSITRSFVVLVILAITCAAFPWPTIGAGGADGLVSLNCKNSDVRDVLRGLGEQAGVNLIVDPSVSGTLTMTLSDVSFETALSVVCETAKLTYVKEGSVYRVVRKKHHIQFEQNLLSVEAQQADLAVLLTEISRFTGINIIPHPGVNGQVSLLLHNLPPDKALAIIADASSCRLEVRENIYHFHPSFTPASETFAVTYADGRLSVEARDADISALTRRITVETGIVLALDSGVAGKVNAAFNQLPVEDALRLLFESNGFRLALVDPGCYRVTKPDGFLFIRYQDGKLSMDIRNADLKAVVDELAHQTGYNFLVDTGLNVRVSGGFQNLALMNGLTAFFEANGITLEQQAGVFRVKRLTNQNNIAVRLDENNLLDIGAYSAPLNLLLREVAARTEINLILYSSVNWLVNNTQLHGVTLEQALDLLLQGTAYAWRKIDETYVVADGINLRPDALDFVEVGIIVCKHLGAEVVFNALPPALPQANFKLIKEQNVLVVTGSRKFIEKARAFIAVLDQPSDEMVSEIIQVNNMKAEEALKLIPASIPKTDVLVLREANALAVTGTRSYIKKIRDYVTMIDLPAPMVLFDILVLQVNHNNALSLSAGLSFQYGNVLVKFGGGVTEVSLVDVPKTAVTTNLSVLIDEGIVEVLANPKLVTLSGHQASFQVVTKHRYAIPENTSGGGQQTQPTSTVQTVDAGIDLSIAPWVSADRQITMDIKPKISEYVGSLSSTPGAVSLPTTNERATETTVRVSDGQAIIISGLIQKSTRKNVKKFPILGDIPLIGLLFRKTETITDHTEFIILVTPKILDNPEAMQEYMAEMGDLLQTGQDDEQGTDQKVEDAAEAGSEAEPDEDEYEKGPRRRRPLASEP